MSAHMEESPPPENVQVFKNEGIKCHILHVHVGKGYDISKGWLGDLFDRPDPYLVFWVPCTPNGSKKTRVVKNNANPVWNEEMSFIVNPERDFELRGMLMDQGTAVDQVLGKVRINFSDLPLNTPVEEQLRFKHGSTVLVKFHKVEDKQPHLKFASSLSEAEKRFLDTRRGHTYRAMRSYLGDELGPRDESQVPRVALVCSGGGLRAHVGLSAALQALQGLGVMDCLTYIASLSGSTWYLSDLYSWGEFPEKGPAEFQQHTRDKLTACWLRVLSPARVYSHLRQMTRKRKAGQPISFTDLFGHFIGDLILGSRNNATLSSHRDKVMTGLVPLPLYTCVHIKKDVSARVYQDWVEFSPLQVGFLKHAVFMEPEQFGHKFYMGRTVRGFDEPPLHYLQGVWGSAFSIFLRRVIESSRADALSPPSPSEEAQPDQQEDPGAMLRGVDVGAFQHALQASGDHLEEESAVANPPSEDSDYEDYDVEYSDVATTSAGRRRLTLRRVFGDKIRRRRKRRANKSTVERIFGKLLRVQLLDTRAGRAGVIFSPTRGISFAPTYQYADRTPSTASDDMDFKGFFEPIYPDVRKLYVADSGLNFNLPFPPLFRKHRDVSLYLCFDFTSRSKDDATPFEELLTAEKWARMHHVRFPPVERLLDQLPDEPLRECYLFEDPDDPLCPVVLHFVLVNRTFRTHKLPGVPRETEAERQFADFDIFSDPDKPYSSFKFSYEPLELDRLLALVEFNTRLHEPLVRQQLARAVALLRLPAS